MGISIPIRKLLSFYDAPDKSDRGHVSAISAVIGEDLGAGLLTHYFSGQGLATNVLPGNVTQGTNAGKRLDRWIVVTSGTRSTYYQVEIKNWGAAAIGGKRIEVGANAATLRKHKMERWSKEWDGQTFIKEGVLKVLTPMKSPLAGIRVKPLICYWDAMHPTGATAPFFSVPLISQKFPRVWVFSMSAYLRNLLKSGEEELEIEASATRSRLEILRRLIRK